MSVTYTFYETHISLRVSACYLPAYIPRDWIYWLLSTVEKICHKTGVTNQKFRVVYVTENKYFSFIPSRLS
jgi:hypothetical protein